MSALDLAICQGCNEPLSLSHDEFTVCDSCLAVPTRSGTYCSEECGGIKLQAADTTDCAICRGEKCTDALVLAFALNKLGVDRKTLEREISRSKAFWVVNWKKEG